MSVCVRQKVVAALSSQRASKERPHLSHLISENLNPPLEKGNQNYILLPELL